MNSICCLEVTSSPQCVVEVRVIAVDFFWPTVRDGGSRHYSRFVLALEFMKDEAKAKKRHFYHRDEDDVW